jgi:hypothetical protein
MIFCSLATRVKNIQRTGTLHAATRTQTCKDKRMSTSVNSNKKHAKPSIPSKALMQPAGPGGRGPEVPGGLSLTWPQYSCLCSLCLVPRRKIPVSQGNACVSIMWGNAKCGSPSTYEPAQPPKSHPCSARYLGQGSCRAQHTQETKLIVKTSS